MRSVGVAIWNSPDMGGRCSKIQRCVKTRIVGFHVGLPGVTSLCSDVWAHPGAALFMKQRWLDSKLVA